MLGVAATLSHTAVVWLIAFGGMYISNNLPQNQPNSLQMVSSVIILGTVFGCSGEPGAVRKLAGGNAGE